MPNWCYNSIAIKGKKNDVLAFINRGIENSAKAIKAYGEGTIPTTCDNLEDALETLKNNGVTVRINGDGFDTSSKQELGVMKQITMGTFRPVPTTFLEYDTTNHEDTFKDEAKAQKDTYGVVGWYDFYRLVWFGCKWNSHLNDFNLVYNGDDAILYFTSQTPWSVPGLWLKWIKEEFPALYVFICASEESGAFYFYREISDDGSGEDLTSEIEGRLCAFDDEHECDMTDEDWDARYDLEVELVDSMEGSFYDFVYGY